MISELQVPLRMAERTTYGLLDFRKVEPGNKIVIRVGIIVGMTDVVDPSAAISIIRTPTDMLA